MTGDIRKHQFLPSLAKIYVDGDAREAFLKAHNLDASMSRLGNCYDNAGAESFFHLLKRERIRREIYADHEEAHRDIFNYIEIFYKSKRRHGYPPRHTATVAQYAKA